MCGRYSLTGPNPGVLRSRFAGLGETVELRPRFNIAPTDPVVAVTSSREGVPRGELLRWGLVPHWAKDPKLGAKMINARSETVAEKPAFRDAFARRRCLVLADGFFEWQRHDGGKRAHWIHRPDGQPFAFAGLWAAWGDDGLRTCSIITTRANPRTHAIHDRMPVMLGGPEAERLWLDPGTPSPVLHDLLAPWPEADTAVRAVGPAVNDARHDAPDCLAAAADEPPPLALF